MARGASLISSTSTESRAPDANDRYLLLQSLLGAWPIELLDGATDGERRSASASGIDGYVIKALREAKRHTSWVNVGRGLRGGGARASFARLLRRTAPS